MASSLNNLGLVAHDQGDRAGAKQYIERALQIREEKAPGSPAVAVVKATTVIVEAPLRSP